MNREWTIAWIQLHDPRGRMTFVQNEIIKSALARDDFKKAKQMLIDWKIPGAEPR